jgi:hypothetical protein
MIVGHFQPHREDITRKFANPEHDLKPADQLAILSPIDNIQPPRGPQNGLSVQSTSLQNLIISSSETLSSDP